jgi:protein MpaA
MGKGWSTKIASISIVCLVAVAGCYQAEPTPQVVGRESRPSLPPVRRGPVPQRLVGRSVQGRPISVQVLGQGDDTVLIMATIHGNEPAGTPLVEWLVEHLQDNRHLLNGRRVVVMPVANPDGLAGNTRGNVRGIDLNRNFEAANRIDNGTNGFRALSEPESRAIKSVIETYRPTRIVSIHQPLNCIDYDGPGRALATRMAQYCELPVKKLGGRPGSLGSYTGDGLGIPTITFEMPADASGLSEAALWREYGRALIAAIVYPDHAS